MPVVDVPGVTVGDLLDRLYREFLTPADEQPIRFHLDVAIATPTEDSLTLDTTFMSPEEEALLGPGTLVEVDRELIQIGAFDSGTGIAASCGRGMMGTTPVDHETVYGVIAPTYGRQAAFDAVSDAIVRLWPDLSRITESDSITLSTPFTEVDQEVEAVRYAWANVGAVGWEKWDTVRFHDHFPPSSTGKAITVEGLGASATGYLVYETRFERPAAEFDVLDDMGVEDEWIPIVLLGAVAHLVSGKDLSEKQQDFLTQQLAAQNYPVLTPTRIRQSILSYRDDLLTVAKRAFRHGNDTTVDRHPVI